MTWYIFIQLCGRKKKILTRWIQIHIWSQSRSTFTCRGNTERSCSWFSFISPSSSIWGRCHSLITSQSKSKTIKMILNQWTLQQSSAPNTQEEPAKTLCEDIKQSHSAAVFWFTWKLMFICPQTNVIVVCLMWTKRSKTCGIFKQLKALTLPLPKYIISTLSWNCCPAILLLMYLQQILLFMIN